MRWRDLVLPDTTAQPQVGWWTIPGEHTKNGEPHRVPLTEDAVTLVKAQIPEKESDRGEFVFTGRGGSTILDRAKKAPAAVARVLEIDFRGHDLRRTAATGMAEAGISREHIGRVLNHVEGGARATKVYDRYSYDFEKRAALDAWQRRLRAILTDTKGGNVLGFSKP
jgi:integrase